MSNTKAKPRPLLDVRGAVKAAEAYCLKLFTDADDLRLEEVDLSRNTWHITVSFTTLKREVSVVTSSPYVLRDDSFGLDRHASPQDRRYYRILLIDATSGQPRAMKSLDIL